MEDRIHPRKKGRKGVFFVKVISIRIRITFGFFIEGKGKLLYS
ncbi:hypothetical protein Ct9H90mP29_21840 [bacterium]|nr:MAG: hypothetical protein Ct9H90mP29_21840 [bacterium]